MLSVDVLRGLTILVMLFVNDLEGVRGAPAWMKHIQPSTADGMTFVDVVFPAFLFIVGVSIPFAIGRRLERGEPLRRIWAHVLTRTLGLLIIGVFMVNEESISEHGPLRPALWSLLMYSGAMLAWSILPGDAAGGRGRVVARRVLGALLLLVVAFTYRGSGEPGLIELRPEWWGILGLIGWAYLVACATFIPLRRQLAGVAGMIALLYCLFIAGAAGAFSSLWINRWVDIGSMLGSQAAVTVSGVALGMALAPGSTVSTHAGRIRWALLFGLGLAAAGCLMHTAHGVHRMFIINKNDATPPWCLWSSAITAWAWAGVYWLVDVRKEKRWAAALAAAGQNALLAYLLAPLIYAALTLMTQLARLPSFYDELGHTFALGFWRALGFAVAIIWLAGRLRRAGIQLRL
jgi:predicted acyltransferase